jgi:hypothetical protein
MPHLQLARKTQDIKPNTRAVARFAIRINSTAMPNIFSAPEETFQPHQYGRSVNRGDKAHASQFACSSGGPRINGRRVCFCILVYSLI